MFTEIATATPAGDVMQLRLDGTRAVTPLVQTPFSERNGEMSPDGRWLAYDSDESDRFEVYVRPFLDVKRALIGFHHRRHPAAVGAQRSRAFLPDTEWARDARRVRDEPTWAATAPTSCLRAAHRPSSPLRPPIRCLARRPTVPDVQKDRGTTIRREPATIVVVLNWTEELKRLFPTR